MSKGKASKPHIGIFGRRNYGKSSLINELAQQDVAIVSEIAGTTTDPVKKSIEIPGIGASVLVDTAGIDDSGNLGTKRIEKTLRALKTIDIAILIITNNLFDDIEENLIASFKKYDVPFFIIHNKSDLAPLLPAVKEKIAAKTGAEIINFSIIHPENHEAIVATMQKIMPEYAYLPGSMLGGIIQPGDVVLLVTPIDLEAPEGRMILPQVQAIRDVLDNDAIVTTLKETELDSFLKVMHPKPVIVITDSQVFEKVNKIVPPEIPITGFSVLLAKHNGDFDNYMKGTPHLSKLKDGDRVLILESCTHHVTCDDIGRVKLPNWLKKFSGKELAFDVVAGLDDPPRPITDYAIAIQCGGCMITRKQIYTRIKPAIDAGIPVTNYGMAIAYLHGIYHRAIAPFVKR
jgi:[FeFe] hydrogenase H-cluster maturation GTPase HydF